MARKRIQTKNIGLFVVLNVVVLFFFIVGFGREYVSNIQIEREIYALEQERERLETEQLETLNLIGELSSEYYLEREAREKHGLGVSGETLVVVQDDHSVTNSALAPDTQAALEQTSNPVRWFYYFFNRPAYDELKAL